MLFVTALFLYFCIDDAVLGRSEAAIFLAIVFGYTVYMFRSVKQGEDSEMLAELEEETDIKMPTLKSILYMVVGCTILVFGSDILVEGASVLAARIGVSEAVIGLTVIAVGSSAPELVTSILAARRKHSDLALGNIIGSNLFNITAIGGAAGMVAPVAVAQQFIDTEMWIMLFVSILLIAFMLLGQRISKLAGFILVAGYIGYTFWQFQSTLSVAS